MNTPVGNNEYCRNIKERIENFKIKSPSYELLCGAYNSIDFHKFPQDTIFYFDPPYFITNAEYNDGKRGLEGWNTDKEIELLSYIREIDKAGYKFMLSNVIKHKGKVNYNLKEWIQKHNYNMIEIGKQA